jgi:hypothetical protein
MDDTPSYQRGSDAVRIRLNKRNPARGCADEGTSVRARECPRVTLVYHPGNSTALFAGTSAKPSDGLEPSTPSLPFSAEEGTAGKRGSPRPRKPRKRRGSAESE